MNKFVIILLFTLFPLTSFGMSQVEQEVQQHVSSQLQAKIAYCNEKIAKYRNKVKKYPDSEYHKYKLRKYINRCIPVFAEEAKTIEAKEEAKHLEEQRKRHVQDKAQRQLVR